MNIEINVSNKIARLKDKSVVGVCGNSDYVINFSFDEEWNAYETKTARFKWGGDFTDVVFTGNECPMPIIYNTNTLEIGVYAGELHTTTAAVIYMKKSVLCDLGVPVDPTPDVYGQIMEKLNALDSASIMRDVLNTLAIWSTDNDAGNVRIISKSGDITATNDGGNVTINSSTPRLTASDDGNGNVTVTLTLN